MTKEFFLGLKGFPIEEKYEKYWHHYFILINPTYSASNDKEAQHFRDIFERVRGNSPSIDNVRQFLNFEPIRILWHSPGTKEFRGFAHSDDLLILIKNLRHT